LNKFAGRFVSPHSLCGRQGLQELE
jgi:hypothetical protein